MKKRTDASPRVRPAPWDAQGMLLQLQTMAKEQPAAFAAVIDGLVADGLVPARKPFLP